MASVPLKRAGVRLEAGPASLLNQRGVVTCGNALECPIIDLVERTGLNSSTLRPVVAAAARKAAPPPRTAAAMLSAAERCGHAAMQRTPLPALDAALRGGLLAGTLTELTGASGAGKTQFCTAMAVGVALGGGEAGGSVLYVDTEGAFTAERLLQMMRPAAAALVPPADVAGLVAAATRRVIVHRPTTCDALGALIAGLEETVVRHDVRLVVIDSMASLVRKEFGIRSGAAMSDLLAHEAATLKRVAEEMWIPELATNQVMAAWGGDVPGEAAGESGGVIPALGNTWAHSVNTRIVIEFAEPAGRRAVRVHKSPMSPGGGCQFSIAPQGLVELASTPPMLVGAGSAHVVARTDLLEHETFANADAGRAGASAH